jgi:hypothetical protein
MDANYKSFSNYSSINSFIEGYNVNAKMVDDFIAFALKKGEIEKNDKIMQLSKPQFAHSIKAQIAQQIFRSEGYYRCLSKKDKDILKALEELKRSK